MGGKDEEKESSELQMRVFKMTNTAFNVLKSWAVAQEERKINA